MEKKNMKDKAAALFMDTILRKDFLFLLHNPCLFLDDLRN